MPGPRPDYPAYDGYLAPGDDHESVPEPLDEEAAAAYAKVSRRTIREWRTNGSLTPITRSLQIMGQWYYWPAEVAAAERRNLAGRPRRAAR